MTTTCNEQEEPSPSHTPQSSSKPLAQQYPPASSTVLLQHLHHITNHLLFVVYVELVMICLLYMACPNGCRYNMFHPVEATALTHKGASAFVVYGNVVQVLPTGLLHDRTHCVDGKFVNDSVLGGVGEWERLVEAYEGGFGAGGMFYFGRCLRGLGLCAREHRTMLPSLSLPWSLLISGHQLPISA